jgi:TolB-like protein
MGIALSIAFLAVALLGLLFWFDARQPKTATAGSPINSIAVLPFDNVVPDANAEYLSDGITESLINRLSQLSGLKVASRSSVFRYKGGEQDTSKVGADLNVQAVLTGSVRQVDDQLVITVRLDDALTNQHIWGEQYVRTFKDMLSVQREIAQAVAVPVATSSLMQVPWVQATLPPGKRVGVVTISASTLTPRHLESAGVPLDAPIAGTEQGRELFRVLIKAEAQDLDVDLARADVVDAGRGLCARHPDIGALVLECTNMPPYAAALQAAVGLPVYDIYSMITWFHAGLRPRTFAPGGLS